MKLYIFEKMDHEWSYPSIIYTNKEEAVNELRKQYNPLSIPIYGDEIVTEYREFRDNECEYVFAERWFDSECYYKWRVYTIEVEEYDPNHAYVILRRYSFEESDSGEMNWFAPEILNSLDEAKDIISAEFEDYDEKEKTRWAYQLYDTDFRCCAGTDRSDRCCGMHWDAYVAERCKL